MNNDNIRVWAIGRRVQYAVGLFAILGLIYILFYFIFLYQSPNCFDEELNGDETGVDCGGSCVRICTSDVLPPKEVWVESFRIAEGQYNSVAYIDNQNQTAATPALQYTFELYSDGTLVASRSGTTVLPPNSVYPIFEGKIKTDSDVVVTETKLIMEQADLWVPASLDRSQFRSLDIDLRNADTRPRLDVELENTKLTDAEDVEVVATIFNDAGRPVLASRTLVDKVEARSTSDIVFTWPNSIAKTVKNCIIPTDVVLGIDLSGSMNNDGGEPPQPVTAALSAAGQFAGNLNEEDRAGVVTFATNASVVTRLTTQHSAVSNQILQLGISPSEEQGYTNTDQALRTAWAELNSERHNPDARRVLVLLTDGLPTAKGDEDVITKAEETARAIDNDGIEIYAIGLGMNVDMNFIRNVASSESNSYFAPTGADLARIYAEITSSLCEVGPTRIDIIAKTTTNFAPLR